MDSESNWVEIKGIIEVRTDSDDPDAVFDALDMFDLQSECPEIPDDYCCKDYATGEQNFFYCLVCSCDLRSIKSLRAHVGGKKHINRSLEKKRNDLGIPAPPINMPKLKERKKDAPKVDIYKTLADRLRDTCEPVLGLEVITEFICSNPRKHRMYSCSLKGCSSAWGTSDDMFHHVKNAKHHKNFLQRRFPNDLRIASMNNSEVMAKAMEVEEEGGGYTARDYDVIRKERDDNEYWKIHNRPLNWTEKKEKLGVAPGISANLQPLGSRRQDRKRTISGATISAADDLAAHLFPQFRVTTEMRRAKAFRLLGCMEVMLEVAKKRLKELREGETRRDKSSQGELARKVGDLRMLRLSMEKRRLNQGLPGYDDFTRSMDNLESDMEFCVESSIWNLTKLKTNIMRLEIDAASRRNASKLAKELKAVEDIFRELSLGEASLSRDEREELKREIENLRKQVEEIEINESARECSSIGRVVHLTSSDDSCEEGFETTFKTSKHEMVESFRSEVTLFITRCLRPLVRPHGREGFRIRSNEDLIDLTSSLTSKVVKVEVKTHEESKKSWSKFTFGSHIRRSVEEYVTKKIHKMEKGIF